MTIRSKDLAAMLNVSPATISLVLNNKPGISDKKRKMITDKIYELGCGYLLRDRQLPENSQKDTLPQAMSENNKKIGFVIYKATGKYVNALPFFVYMLDGMEAAAKAANYNLVLLNIEKQAEMDEQMDYLRASGCSGFVICATEMEPCDLDPFYSLDSPFVILDNYFLEKNADCVTVNNEQGIYALVAKMKDFGHKTIGYLDSGVNIQTFHERKVSYFSALTHYGYPDMKQYVYTIGYPETHAYRGMLNILNKGIELPTAFICDNDLIAAGAIKAVLETGYKIPQDISIVGFADYSLCTAIVPAITTVRVHRTHFGKEAIKLLIEKIDGSGTSEVFVKREVSVKLIMRESLGIALSNGEKKSQ